MEITCIVRQTLLYGHIIAFALAITTILKEDVRLLRAKRIDPECLLATAKLVKWLLLALWVTGIPMVIMDIGTDASLLLGKPKLLVKLIVVGALTLNGILLHLVAFPMITGKVQNANNAATVAVTLGAVSTTSWLYVSFLGAGRLVAPYFSLSDFALLYILALILAVLLALMFVRNRLTALLVKSSLDLSISADQGDNLRVALLEADAAWLALAEIQALLQANDFERQTLLQKSRRLDGLEVGSRKFAAELAGTKAAITERSVNSRQDLSLAVRRGADARRRYR